MGKYKNQNIAWKVLKCEGDKYLLIADKALDCIPYNTELKETTWEKCTLRQWLNNRQTSCCEKRFRAKRVGGTAVERNNFSNIDLHRNYSTCKQKICLSWNHAFMYSLKGQKILADRGEC